jgi:hypothetical protein
VETKKAGRIIALYVVTSSLVQKGASPASIKTSLEKHVYADLDGNLDSVITALHQDKYPLNVLINIAEFGFQKFLEAEKLADSIYNQLISANVAAS